MKKLFFILQLILGLSILGNAQITLTYDNHALEPNITHKTQYVENVSQGFSGENQIWDFSTFACNNLKISEIFDASETKDASKFPNCNISVLDDGNYFYFNVDETVNEYIGLITPDAVITFEKPVIRMVYPFTYGDFVSGVFYGEGLYYGEIISNISGTYEVTADGYGTLLLPNNVSVENVLRVKSVNHLFETACNTTEFYNEKYLWYSEDNRLPIMVVVINKKNVDGVETVTNYGYYNEDAFETNLEETNSEISEFSLNVYPNPFTEIINISYNVENEQKVTVEIYSPTGQVLAKLVDNELQKGSQLLNYNVNNKSFAVGNYYVRIQIGEKIIMKKIIKFD